MSDITTVDELIALKKQTIDHVNAEKQKCDETTKNLNLVKADLQSELETLEDQMRGLEGRIDDVDHKYKAEMLLSYAPLDYYQNIFMERLQASFLKNLPVTWIPTRSKRPKDGELQEEIIIMTNPLVRIYATIHDESQINVYSRKRVNNIICRINLEWSKIFKNDKWLAQMEGNNYYNWEGYFNIQGKAFKTREEAKAWLDKNGGKYYNPVINNLLVFFNKIEAAEPDFSKVFDFRLFTGDELTRNYCRDNTYVVLSKTKTEIVLDLKPIHEDFYEALNDRKLDNPIVVFLDGINFRIVGGTEEDREQIDGALRKYFRMEVWNNGRQENNGEDKKENTGVH